MKASELAQQIIDLVEEHGDLTMTFINNGVEDDPCYSVIEKWDLSFIPELKFRIARGIYTSSPAILIGGLV